MPAATLAPATTIGESNQPNLADDLAGERMTDLEAAVLIDRLSAELAEALRPRLREMERESDRLLGEMNTLRRRAGEADRLGQELRAREARLTELNATAESWAAQLIEREAQLSVSRARSALLEQLYTDSKRPTAHDHPTEAGAPPTIVFDLHRTLTPSMGFLEPDQRGAMQPPFDGVRETLDGWAAQGICLHLCTAALSLAHDPLVRAARTTLIQAWLTHHSLPISFVSGKVSAHTYYDDRMVPVPASGNWNAVAKGVEAQLEQRAELGKNGIRKLINLAEQGEKITDWPEPGDVLPDQPRGLSTSVLDVDIHRCLSQANSSTRDAPLVPGALEAMRQIFAAGYTIHLSCAGWDPSTHTAQESDRRLAGLRQMVRECAVPYDEIVSKDHGTAFVDDKGLTHQNWKKDLPSLLSRLSKPNPQDEVTEQSGEPPT